MYGRPTAPTHHRPAPDCTYLHAERRKPASRLSCSTLEYLEQHPDGYRYTQFCERYRRWLKQRRKTLDLTQEALAERVGCAVPTPGISTGRPVERS